MTKSWYFAKIKIWKVVISNMFNAPNSTFSLKVF
jgi:hypothetical protein